jgi:hypothetical protein
LAVVEGSLFTFGVIVNLNLKELLDHTEDSIRAAYEKDPGAHPPPMFITIDSNGTKNLLVTPWNGEDEKTLVLRNLKKIFRETGVVAYLNVTEAWVTKQFHSGKPPSECEDREEVVMISAVSKEGSMGRLLYIVREKDGDVVDLVRRGDNEVTGLTGRLVELLDNSLDSLIPKSNMLH